MPNFNIIKKINYEHSFRNQNIIDNFDLDDVKFEEQFKGNINIENTDWNIGLIVGGSGTGKTTIAKEIFNLDECSNHKFTDKSIVDEMPEHCNINEITNMFNSVGFGSVTSWLKPYNVLSQADNTNDIDMFKACGYKVAMKNASEELKEIADYVTLSNNEAGVGDFIEKFILK